MPNGKSYRSRVYQLVRESADNENAVEASAEESETVRTRDAEKPEG